MTKDRSTISEKWTTSDNPRGNTGNQTHLVVATLARSLTWDPMKAIYMPEIGQPQFEYTHQSNDRGCALIGRCRSQLQTAERQQHCHAESLYRL